MQCCGSQVLPRDVDVLFTNYSANKNQTHFLVGANRNGFNNKHCGAGQKNRAKMLSLMHKFAKLYNKDKSIALFLILTDFLVAGTPLLCYVFCQFWGKR